jgi:hypothetical protein
MTEMKRSITESGLLYHGDVAPRSLAVTRTYRLLAALTLAVLLLATAVKAGPVPDRLERFREIASDRLSAVQVLDAASAAQAYREAYALLDEEIVESLGSGGVFASTAFLQDRVDAFGDAWGGAAARIVRLGSLTVGVFQLGDRVFGNSVRVYGKLRDETALLTALAREGRPTLYPLPNAANGVVQFLVSWDGTQSGRANRPLQLEVARQQSDGVRVTWTTGSAYPDGLVARSYSVRGQELRVRHELRYRGWVPGCDGQTEQEDVYRFSPGTGLYVRVSQRQFDSWHRELHASAERLFAALAAGDRNAVAGLVPDPRVRQRLPATLTGDAACDSALGGAGGEQVSIAASDGRGVPWNVTFQRAGARWRVTSAAPVIP